MKKWFDIAVLGILVSLVACTKTENTAAPEAISYTVGRYATATKADTHSEYRTAEGLEVFQSKAFLHTEGAAEGTLFFNSAISWDGATWSPERDYYWPKHPQSYLNFVSWYANDGSANITPDTVTETQFQILNRTVGANDRILVADEAWKQKANGNTYYTSGVPTLFRHVLSRVKVNMKATTLTDPELSGVTYEVTLQDAKFEGVFQKGNMKLLNSALADTGTRKWYSTESATYLWKTVAGSNEDAIDFVDSDADVTTDYAAILPERSFIPQALGDAIKLVITYSVTTKNNGIITATESDIPATIVMNTIKNTSDVAITQWVPNKIYTYNIAINPVGKEILLNPTVETEWTFAEDINVTVE